MLARRSTASACVDLFFKIGASRGQNIIPAFTAAYVEDREIALRIAQWARDVRGGSGERELYRQILGYLEVSNPADAEVLMRKTPEIGRWDDLLVFTTRDLKSKAYAQIGDALRAGNGLAAKWMPRQGKIAAEIRKFYGMTPRDYRKSLVNLTRVVESQMCSNDWDNINYSQVPSLAHARYKKAFGRHGTTYAEYVAKLASGATEVKINAAAVYPYDVLKGRINLDYTTNWDKTELDAIQAQWDALPNFVNQANILPLVDVSGSMCIPVGGNPNLTCLDISVSLGLYFADKNTGKFRDCFLTFSGKPELLRLQGSINQKIDQMVKSKWGMNTNLHAAFDRILEVAVQNQVPESEMPGTLVIFSDMQFDQCVTHDDTALAMIERKYNQAGYQIPRVVFWNLRDSGNVPVRFDTRGTALLSGFSPAVVRAVVAGDMDNFTPEAMMLRTVMVDRYAI